MDPFTDSGIVEIRGKAWRWAVLDPQTDAPVGDVGDDAVFVVFQSPNDPGREMRCVARDHKDFPPSEEMLRRLFDRAWAVKH